MSTSTVSRALNGYQDVSEQTRKRVQDMAKALGYHPDAAARRLVRGHTDAVGIVYAAGVESLGNPQFLDMAGGLAERLAQENQDLLLVVAKDDEDLGIYERLFHGGRVDAVVVANTRLHDIRIEYLLKKGYPFLAYGRTESCDNYSWFDFDNALGSVLAVQHLVSLGHTRIAYVHSPLELNFAVQRYRGFMDALQEAGAQCDPAWQIGPAADRRSGYDAIMQLLACKRRPTAVVIDSSLGGIGVLRGLVDAGVQVGRDMSVVVHGEIVTDTLLHDVNVTRVVHPTAQASGLTMAEMVLRVVRQPLAGPFQLLRNPELVLGASTARVKGQPRKSAKT